MTYDGQPQAVISPSSTTPRLQHRITSSGTNMEDKCLLQSPRVRRNDSTLLSFDNGTDGDWRSTDTASTERSSPRAASVEVSPNASLNCLPSIEDEGFYDGRPLLRGSPAKPKIMSGNALHLHLEEHDVAGSGPSIRFAPDPPSISKPQSSDLEIDASHLSQPIPRVRFRSRVRIASGLHRHRKHHPASSSDSSTSSRSSSPCSSLSAPLRYQADENSVLGPLGRRLSAYAAAGGFKHKVLASPGPQRQYIRTQVKGYYCEVSESSSLLRAGSRARSYGDGEPMASGSGHDHRNEMNEDAEFGTWPRRLLNYHWWWWQLEPILCCFCVDDSDTDE